MSYLESPAKVDREKQTFVGHLIPPIQYRKSIYWFHAVITSFTRTFLRFPVSSSCRRGGGREHSSINLFMHKFHEHKITTSSSSSIATTFLQGSRMLHTSIWRGLIVSSCTTISKLWQNLSCSVDPLLAKLFSKPWKNTIFTLVFEELICIPALSLLDLNGTFARMQRVLWDDP